MDSEAKAYIQSATGRLISNNDLLLEALDTSGLRAPQANRRLALLGDQVLKTAILDDWYQSGEMLGW